MMKLHLSEVQLCSLSKYSIKLAYSQLVSPSGNKMYWANAIWCKLAQPKHRFISWLAVLERLSTKDRLKLFGVSVDDLCLLCGVEVENHSHLFFGCQYSSRCWEQIAGFLQINTSIRSLPQLIKWIHRRKFTKFRKGVLFTFAWCLVYHGKMEDASALKSFATLSRGAIFAKSDASSRARGGRHHQNYGNG
ncbi:uncharacterized protein [Spinacia oleracea]|uniref:Reverse transcriptase zinc-binding domain-containing protein n=1 Tax=Spinacia oleracea TaxID=3562 RepID=A0A9R0JYX2_SPIOL|nr:uncharacterized protein LOC110791780 [Spinacia oleracea]